MLAKPRRRWRRGNCKRRPGYAQRLLRWWVSMTHGSVGPDPVLISITSSSGASLYPKISRLDPKAVQALRYNRILLRLGHCVPQLCPRLAPLDKKGASLVVTPGFKQSNRSISVPHGKPFGLVETFCVAQSNLEHKTRLVSRT